MKYIKCGIAEARQIMQINTKNHGGRGGMVLYAEPASKAKSWEDSQHCNMCYKAHYNLCG